MARPLAGLSVAAIVAVSVCAAQNPFGRVSGRVTDSAGAVAPGARITVVHQKRYTLEFRGEARDAMNHPVFAAPNGNPTALNFGSITANAAPEQRRINLVGKFAW